MSDEAIIDIRLSNIERDCSEIKTDVGKIDERLDRHAEWINTLDHWYRGNEAKGAERRLQDVEGYCMEMNKANLGPRMNAAEANIEVLRGIADAKLETIRDMFNDTLNARSKTTVERMKAWGSLLTPILAAAAVVLAAVL